MLFSLLLAAGSLTGCSPRTFDPSFDWDGPPQAGDTIEFELDGRGPFYGVVAAVSDSSLTIGESEIALHRLERVQRLQRRPPTGSERKAMSFASTGLAAALVLNLSFRLLLMGN